nr:hypothetical protein [Tanacetum cinerariifolium]
TFIVIFYAPLPQMKKKDAVDRVDVEKPHKMASAICTGRKGNMRRESKQDLNNVPG